MILVAALNNADTSQPKMSDPSPLGGDLGSVSCGECWSSYLSM